jgi:hypothetical protein
MDVTVGYWLCLAAQQQNNVTSCEPDAPFGPYEKYSPRIEDIHTTFQNQIFLPLLTTWAINRSALT